MSSASEAALLKKEAVQAAPGGSRAVGVGSRGAGCRGALGTLRDLDLPSVVTRLQDSVISSQ